MMPNSKPRNARGFTFLEIMFVVVIIGVLMAIAIPRFAGRAQEARISATEATMNGIRTALSQYEMHVGSFPSTTEGLEALMERPNSVDEDMWEGPYIEGDEVPVDSWKQPFNYVSPGTKKRDYDLWSNGPDRQEGTDDDITNWSKKK